MVDYISEHQIKIKEFGMIHKLDLDPENRWIQLGEYLPWDKLVEIFKKYFADCGRPTINPRIKIW